jgi:hypothetical protein
LVDVDAGRVRDELFAPNREEELIQAISFEQLEPLVLSESSSDGATEGVEAADEDQFTGDAPESEKG